MKIEYLEDGSPDCPLIRLYEFIPEEAIRLRESFLSLASGKQDTIELHNAPGMQSMRGCCLTLRLGQRDVGLVRTGPTSFKCVLTASAWSNLAGLTEPFQAAEMDGHYQWLSEHGKANLLLSPLGDW